VGFVALVVLAVGLSMDAFALAIGIGLAARTPSWKRALVVGAYFGGFQALMPLIGYFVARLFAAQITRYDHWIAFALLGFIGAKMIWESFHDDDDEAAPAASLGPATMVPLAIAESIDALAAGVSFAFLSVNVLGAVVLIGVITFGFAVVGVRLGGVLGNRFKAHAELVGGIVLILLGVNIVLEHLGVISF